VARLFAGDPEGIANALIQGIGHKGFSFFHVYTSCVTFDKEYKTWDHLKQWVHSLPAAHDPKDLKQAINESLEDQFSLGILYKRQE